MRWIYPVLGMLVLAGCGRPAAPATVTPAAEPSATATWTATATPGATATLRPTDLPSATATASPAPSSTPTSTPEPTATAASVAGSPWELPVIAAAVTQMTIQEIEQVASVGGAPLEALGYGIALRAVDEALAEWEPGTQQAGYRERLRANIEGVVGVVGQWYDGGMGAGAVVDALRPWRAESEQVLSDLADELRRLGVSQEQIDAFMADVMAGM